MVDDDNEEEVSVDSKDHSIDEFDASDESGFSSNDDDDDDDESDE